MHARCKWILCANICGNCTADYLCVSAFQRRAARVLSWMGNGCVVGHRSLTVRSRLLLVPRLCGYLHFHYVPSRGHPCRVHRILRYSPKHHSPLLSRVPSNSVVYPGGFLYCRLFLIISDLEPPRFKIKLYIYFECSLHKSIVSRTSF